MTLDFDRQMQDLLRMAARPMVVVTVAVGDERDGCLVGYHSAVSISPRRYLVCLSTRNRTHELATGAGTLAVHHLEVFHEGLARRFGEETGYEIDKFAGIDWHRGPDGVPILDDVTTWWAGRTVEQITLGDHTGFVLEPFIVEAGENLQPFDSRHAGGFQAGELR